MNFSLFNMSKIFFGFATTSFVAIYYSMLSVSPANALCLDLWNDDCDLIPDSVMPEVIEANDFRDVYIQNNTTRTIWVAAHYYSGTSRNIPENWRTAGYWVLNPGEKAYVLGGSGDSIKNPIIYFHAHDDQGVFWGNNRHQFRVGGEIKPFFQVHMGEGMVYTQRFVD